MKGKIREKLLSSGNIYVVIGLPVNLFYNTSITTDNKLILKSTPKINATEKDYQAFKTMIGDFRSMIL